MMEHYLTVMGIDRWTRRQSASPVLPACYADELWHGGQCVGVLFATAAEENATVLTLLQKMVAAIRCEPHGQWYVTQPDYASLRDIRFVITLGEGFEVMKGVKHIHSYSPQRLLTEPALKAETWKALQTVFELL